MMGRKPKYNNCLDLDIDCELYFESCVYEDEGDYVMREKPIPFTITGLALAIGATRQTIMNYQKRQDFFGTIKRHKTRIENFAEQRLFGNNPTGAIFSLKNFGWSDKQQLEHTGPDGGPIQTKHTAESALKEMKDRGIPIPDID